MKLPTFTLLALLLFTYSTHAQNALAFDGIDDFIQTDFEGILNTSERTFEAWIYILDGTESSNMAILDHGNNETGSRNTFSVDTAQAKLRYISGGNNANLSSAENSIPIEEWFHVAFVYQDSIGYFFVNGLEVASGDLSAVNTPSNFGTVRIGQRVNGGNIPFKGGLDESRIWNVSRSQEEIQEYMNVEICDEHPNLSFYMRFNQGNAQGDNQTINVALDESDNANHGDLLNFVLTGMDQIG